MADFDEKGKKLSGVLDWFTNPDAIVQLQGPYSAGGYKVDAQGRVYNYDGSINGPLTGRNQAQGAAMSTNANPNPSADLNNAIYAQMQGREDQTITYYESQLDNAAITGGEVATNVGTVAQNIASVGSTMLSNLSMILIAAGVVWLFIQFDPGGYKSRGKAGVRRARRRAAGHVRRLARVIGG